MNTKLLLKTIFLVLVALLLVLMGMNNQSEATLKLPPIIPETIKQPAAIMYVLFFGVGLVTGVIITAGIGGKSGSKSKSNG